jgi:twinkle protein
MPEVSASATPSQEGPPAQRQTLGRGHPLSLLALQLERLSPVSRWRAGRLAAAAPSQKTDGTTSSSLVLIMLNERHAKLLEDRGFDIELLDKLGIESSAKLGLDTIAIPIHEAGVKINTKYRTIAGEKRFCQEPGCKPVFWNVDCLTDETLKDQPLIITEGELDAIAAIQSGFGRVVSVPNGAPKTEGQDAGARYKFLENAPKALHQCKEILLATDADRPGLVLMNDLALRLGRVRCRWLKYPAGCKDLGDVLAKYGQREVVETINRAQWFEIDGLYRMAGLPPLPELTPLDSGFPWLKDHWKLREGDLAVVSGVPSSGKTTVVNVIACMMAMRHRWQTVFASFEQVPQRDHRRFLRTWFNAKLVAHQTPEEIDKADAWINHNFLFVVPGDDDEPSLEWVLERLSMAVVRHGVKLCIIDPWNELSHERGEMTATDYVGYALRHLKRFARKHMVVVIVVAHPMKPRRLENGRFPIPCLYDIADSAHWKNRCDVGVIVHRETEEITMVRVEKVRYHDEIGRPGDVYVRYDWHRATFGAAEQPNPPKRKESNGGSFGIDF